MHGKSYDNSDDHIQAHGHWKDNDDYINLHNHDHRQGKCNFSIN